MRTKKSMVLSPCSPRQVVEYSRCTDLPVFIQRPRKFSANDTLRQQRQNTPTPRQVNMKIHNEGDETRAQPVSRNSHDYSTPRKVRSQGQAKRTRATAIRSGKSTETSCLDVRHDEDSFTGQSRGDNIRQLSSGPFVPLKRTRRTSCTHRSRGGR